MAILFAFGSSSAALACVSPQMDAQVMPLKGACPDMGKAHDCALACAPMCTAMAPAAIDVEGAPVLSSAPLNSQILPLAVRRFGPEPPPPRQA
ncbi:MAG: hypothetical protein ABIO68_00680 [Sphingomicrobium sp.]